MKLFRDAKTQEVFYDCNDNDKYIISAYNGVIHLKSEIENLEEISTKPVEPRQKMSAIVRTEHEVDTNTIVDMDWKLKDELVVPIGDKMIPFRVEHIANGKVYFVATEAVGKSNMNDMNDFLDAFESEMPEDLLRIMDSIEHEDHGERKKRKVSLMSWANVSDNLDGNEYNGLDDILFDGMKTYAERCRNFNGETDWYWLDTRSHNTTYSTYFMYVGTSGIPNYYNNAPNSYAVVPCFSIYLA